MRVGGQLDFGATTLDVARGRLDHSVCVATGRLAWFGILIGRLAKGRVRPTGGRDGRRHHSQNGRAPQDLDAGQYQ